MDLQKKIQHLFSTQRQAWKLLDDNCNQMSNIELKWLEWKNDAEVVLQYNPSRIISASAKVDKKSIEERKCFLCAENRPNMQQGISFMDKYIILCNPFPILQNHLTIPLHSHVPQLIGKKINDMLSLSELLPDYVVFYNNGFKYSERLQAEDRCHRIGQDKPVIYFDIGCLGSIDDKIEGIESGADAYISKPFSIEYLKTVARKLIEKHRKLREYYKSVASSFDYVNGQLLPKEDRDFIQAVIQSIEQNICDEEFSPEDLAEELCVSLRSLYRRFKDLDLLPPKEFIKKQRIEYSAKLLVSTKLTVQEIMYNAGFTTRSHFYKEFTKFYNMSPKEYREQENSVF